MTMASASSSVSSAVAVNTPTHGQIQQAMAYRVKYRVMHKEGAKQVQTVIIAIRKLGVHMKNRGGVYPNVDILKELCTYLLDNGFLRSEADHQGVCVQDVPASLLRDDVKALGPYNCEKVKHSTDMHDLFDGSSLEAGTLSHSHLIMVLRAWLMAAKWDLKTKDGFPRYCDEQGRLNMTAVAEDPNATEMLQVINEGIRMEVLSYKIYLEEPKACSLISNALNKGHEIALRTTELTALECLTGELALRANASLSQAVCFDSVKEALRGELDVYVDEPDFLEMFEFSINMGGSKHTYLSGLLDFGSKFVNQKKRRLRLGVFSDVNKMRIECPKSKIAVLKRAYRKTPQFGYCPSPESSWSKKTLEELRTLEHLLHYYHVELKDWLATCWEPDKVLLLLANVDVAAADAFIASDEPKQRENVLKATLKYYQDLTAVAATKKTPLPASNCTWIKYDKEAQKNEKQSEKTSAISPRVLDFDEATGNLLTKQEEKDGAAQERRPTILPWQFWWSENTSLGEDVAACDAVVSVLFNIHRHPQSRNAHVQVLYDENKKMKRVVATQDIAPGSLILVPCVPRTNKVSSKSDHPFRVQVIATLKQTEAEEGTVLYINPEWRQPETKEATAFQELNGLEVDWEWKGNETMNPFWAVRRLTHMQMAQEHKTPTVKGFNVKMTDKEFSQVIVGSLQGDSMSTTWSITLPVMTNEGDIKLGDELILQHETTSKPEKRKTRTWKSDVREAEAQKKRGSEGCAAKHVTIV